MLFPECFGWGTRGRGFKKFSNFFPECCTREEVFEKKWWTAPTVSNLSRVLVWHSGKASPCVRFLALGEDLFPVRDIPSRSSPSVALGRVFPRVFGEAGLSRSVWTSRKRGAVAEEGSTQGRREGGTEGGLAPPNKLLISH
jgi:hypothetical protein